MHGGAKDASIALTKAGAVEVRREDPGPELQQLPQPARDLARRAGRRAPPLARAPPLGAARRQQLALQPPALRAGPAEAPAPVNRAPENRGAIAGGGPTGGAGGGVGGEEEPDEEELEEEHEEEISRMGWGGSNAAASHACAKHGAGPP